MYERDCVCVTAYTAKRTVESKILQSGRIILDQPSNSILQTGFPQKIGKNVRGVSETHGYCNVTYAFRFACHVYRIAALHHGL